MVKRGEGRCKERRTWRKRNGEIEGKERERERTESVRNGESGGKEWKDRQGKERKTKGEISP